MRRTALSASISFRAAIPAQQGVAADRVVFVDAARMTPAAPFMQGFLHGFQPNDTLVSTRVGVHLRPSFWRLGFADGRTMYRRVAPSKPPVTMVISDLFADTKGGHSNVQPWRNWPELERFCSAHVQRNAREGKPVAFWDIWCEPGTEANWTGS